MRGWQPADSIGIVTALNPLIGYDKSTELAAEALATRRGIIELVLEKGLLDENELRAALDPRSMTRARRKE